VNCLRKSRSFAARSVLQQKINDSKFTAALRHFGFCWGQVLQNGSLDSVSARKAEHLTCHTLRSMLVADQ
jgi:hypothetical protein